MHTLLGLLRPAASNKCLQKSSGAQWSSLALKPTVTGERRSGWDIQLAPSQLTMPWSMKPVKVAFFRQGPGQAPPKV